MTEYKGIFKGWLGPEAYLGKAFRDYTGSLGSYIKSLEVRNDRLAAEKETFAHSIAALVTLNQEANRKSLTDSLTGLWNRTYFDASLPLYVKAAEEGNYALTLELVDVDDFKGINDSFGHHAGDIVLSHVGAKLKEHCRDADLVYRIGGDEFAVIMPHTGIRQAARIARRLMESAKNGVKNIPPVTFSAGIASYDPVNSREAYDPLVLFQMADQALYKAKRTGKNNISALF